MSAEPTELPGPHDHRRVTDLFLDALDTDPDARAGFLDRACRLPDGAADRVLRAEVEVPRGGRRHRLAPAAGVGAETRPSARSARRAGYQNETRAVSP